MAVEALKETSFSIQKLLDIWAPEVLIINCGKYKGNKYSEQGVIYTQSSVEFFHWNFCGLPRINSVGRPYYSCRQNFVSGAGAHRQSGV